MKINFGYVAMSKILEDCSPSKTVTVKNLSKIEDEDSRIYKLSSLAKTNLKNTQRLFWHNKAHDIKVFRMSSKLIPLATHEISNKWNWVETLERELKALGDYALKHQFRISAHPDHFTLLNSPREEVTKASIMDLDYHHKIFEAMGLGMDAKLIIHVGGIYDSKEDSIRRFHNNYSNLPSYLKNRIVLENDDKSYTVRDVLAICQDLGIPMVLDIHHHWCNNEDDDIKGSLPSIFETWKNEAISPKIHVSSPKDEKKFRYHADDISAKSFLNFLKKAKVLDRDFDVMIEAKNKDLALLKLMEDLKVFEGVKQLDQASIEY